MLDQELASGRTQQQPPTLRELVVVLFRRRRVFVSVAALVLTAAVLYALFGTKYQANMKVLVRRGRAEAPVSAGVNAPLDLTRIAVTEEELNSEVELLRGADVMRSVVEQTGVGHHDWLRFLRPNESHAERIERSPAPGKKNPSRTSQENKLDFHQLCDGRSADGAARPAIARWRIP